MKATPFFRWYDLWVGAYWDRKARVLYVCPLPMFGVAIHFARRWRPCLNCHATGLRSFAPERDCEHCDGRGRFPV